MFAPDSGSVIVATTGGFPEGGCESAALMSQLGPLASILAYPRDVCFTPGSDRIADIIFRPLCAMSGQIWTVVVS